MAILMSDNPNNTRARARSNGASLRYPLSENMSSFTRLRFVKYNRFNPSDGATEETTSTITLPLPINVPENYSINNTAHDLGIFGNVTNENAEILRRDGNVVDMSNLEAITKLGISSAISSIRQGSFNPVAALGGLLRIRGQDDTARTVSSFTGIVQNPHTTMIFDGVNLRPINLEWRFSARSEDESRALKNIYDTIKLAIHPEELVNGYALNYPDLLYVEFDGKAAEYLPKFKKAMVSSIHITPDSSGGIPLFKSGAPVGYNFQLMATEIEILTRNSIQEQINGTV